MPAGIFPMRFEKAGWRHICGIEQYLVPFNMNLNDPVLDTPQKLNLNIAPESHDGKLEDDPFRFLLGLLSIVRCELW